MTAGSTFTGWSGGGCSGTEPCGVTVSDSTAVTATFALRPVETATPTPTPTETATPTPTAAETATPEAAPATNPATNPGNPAPTPQATPTPTAPNTRLVKTTIKKSKRTATFTFKAVGTATRYRCALTARGKKVVYKACKPPATFKKLEPGRYTFRVQAVGPAGTDRTPASKTITIKK